MNAEERKKKQEMLVALFGRAPIKKTTGMELRYDEEGRAVFEMPYNPSFDHAMSGIHGGVLMTLLDNAGWFTAALYSDYWIATAEITVRLLEPVSGVDLWSRGRVLKAGSRLIVAEMEVRTKGDERLVAVGQGTFVPTSVPIK